MQQNKKDYVRSLSNVKLIIGNGFDLHCKMDTSYKDYFLHDKDKNNYFLSWIKEFENTVDDYLKLNSENHKDFWLPFKNFEQSNIWDFFFYLNSNIRDDRPQKEWLWCDIEKTMLQWFKSYRASDLVEFNNNWEKVYGVIERNELCSEDNSVKILAAVAYKKNGEKKFRYYDEFYLFLLKELKLFEKNFGKYIRSIHFHINSSFQQQFEKTNFNIRAMETIEELCDLNNLVSIDSFNYDNIRNENVRSIIHNINGNWDNPIFGIDSNAFPASDIRYIFSKTNRRMELEMLNEEETENKSFDNVVIYGHSLNAADYSYFFSIFDKMHISELISNSKVVFAYSVYDEGKREKIEMDLRNGISKLFSDYSEYLGRDRQPNRLLDILTTQGKILIYKIPELSF